MADRRYSSEEVVRVASRYLTGREISRCLVATLKRPAAFRAIDGLLEAMLARRFLEIADGVLSEGESGT